MARCWQGRLQGALCEERPGLPCAGHRQFQQPYHRARLRKQDGGASGKGFKKGGKHHTQEEAEGRQRLEEEEVLCGPRADVPFSM